MRFILPLLLAFLLAGNASATPTENEKLSLISEFVVCIKMPNAFRQGMKDAPRGSAAEITFRERAATLPDDVLVRLAVATYSKRMSYSEAKEVADFYRSSAGKKLITIQTRNMAVANPAYSEMTPLEIAAARQFSNSPGTLSFREAGKDPAFFRELQGRVQDYLRGNLQ
jgi:hypothetical protein